MIGFWILIIIKTRTKKTIKPCKHERGEFQYWLAQGIKYFKCKKCGENYAE